MAVPRRGPLGQGCGGNHTVAPHPVLALGGRSGLEGHGFVPTGTQQAPESLDVDLRGVAAHCRVELGHRAVSRLASVVTVAHKALDEVMMKVRGGLCCGRPEEVPEQADALDALASRAAHGQSRVIVHSSAVYFVPDAKRRSSTPTWQSVKHVWFAKPPHSS